jgi:uncharacterized protein YndB with AHSA1/START domain
MLTDSFTRRELVFALASMPAALGIPAPAARAAEPNAAGAAVATRAPEQEQEISRSALAIHQEVLLPASRPRVYRALTEAKAFDRVVRLSEAVASGMVPAAAKPSRISPRVGGAFSLFGGYVSGLQVELVHDQRIVQVWRAGSWPAGEFSIARFELTDEGAGTRLVFDHRGFPAAEAAHLAQGWHANYWQPLAQSSAQPGHWGRGAERG